VGLLLILTGITGLAFPLLVTALAQLDIPRQIEGSLLLPKGSHAGVQNRTELKRFKASPSPPAVRP
jgi:K+-transporting ATPase c subunit